MSDRRYIAETTALLTTFAGLLIAAEIALLHAPWSTMLLLVPFVVVVASLAWLRDRLWP